MAGKGLCNAISKNGRYCENKTQRRYCEEHKGYDKTLERQKLEDYVLSVFDIIKKRLNNEFPHRKRDEDEDEDEDEEEYE